MVSNIEYGRVGVVGEVEQSATICGSLDSMVSLLRRPPKDAYSSVWADNLDRLAAVVLRSPTQELPQEELAEAREFLQTPRAMEVRGSLIENLKQFELTGEPPANRPLRANRIQLLFGNLSPQKK